MAYMDNNFSEHYLLGPKDKGALKRLCGDVISLVFFVNDSVSSWNDGAKEEYLAAHNEALEEISSQARTAGVTLTFRTGTWELSIQKDCTIENAYDCQRDLSAALCSKSVTDYQNYYLSHYEADCAPIAFAFNKKGRSFAMAARPYYATMDEYSTLFRDENGAFCPRSVMHELLHQFGAVDYYYPELVKSVADRYFPRSIMNIGYEYDRKIDLFTAYMIGWEKELSGTARAFLSETSALNESAVRAGWNKTVKGN